MEVGVEGEAGKFAFEIEISQRLAMLIQAKSALSIISLKSSGRRGEFSVSQINVWVSKRNRLITYSPQNLQEVHQNHPATVKQKSPLKYLNGVFWTSPLQD